MIHYAKKYWGLPLIFRVHGSPFPRTIPFAVLSVSITTALQASEDLKSDIVKAFGHPYPFQVYAFVIGFLVVLRTNHALARFMEARSHVQWMGSKWADAVVMLAAFDGVTSGRRGAPKTSQDAPNEGSDLFVARLVHLMSLMHALALQNLRGDEVLDNLVAAPRRRFTTGPDLSPVEPRDAPTPNLSSVDVNAPDDVEVFVDASDQMPVERARYHVGGAHVLHAATENQHTPRFKFLNALLLTEDDESWRRCCEALPLDVIGGMDPHERREIESLACDRVYLVMSWIQALIARRMESEEGLRVAPPILSRVHQVLTDGILGFNQADKISTTPFPMPYSQMLTMCLLVFNITLPLMVAGNINAMWLAILVNVISTVAYQGLNEVARELEDPFKPTHLNDVGMPQLQAMFNSKIRAGTPGSGKHLEHWNKCSRRVERGLSFASTDAEGNDANGTS